MSVAEGEPLPGTQNVDGSDKPEFAVFDPEKGESLAETPSADDSGDESDDESDDKPAKKSAKKS